MDRLNETKCCMHIISDNICVGIVRIVVVFLLSILRMSRWIETKVCIHLNIDYVAIVYSLCNMVTALDLHQNMVFAQYLENE